MAGLPDHYEILQVHPRAGPEIIKRAYRTLSREYHPDANPPEKRAWAQDMMARLNEAYRVLSDPVARREYDAQREGGAFAGVASANHRATETAQAAVRSCQWHPERPRVSICSICGKSVCAECRRTSGMAVVCPDCEGRPVRTAGADTPRPRARRKPESPVRGPAGLAAAWRELRRADVAAQVAFAVLLVAMGFLLTGLWVRGLIALVALRFPGHLGAVTPLAIGFAVLCVTALGVAMAAGRLFRRPGATTVMALAISLGALWAVDATVRRPFSEEGDEALQEGRLPDAVMRYSYASWQAGPGDTGLRQQLGRTYLAAFAESTQVDPPGNPVLAHGALVNLAQHSSPGALKGWFEQPTPVTAIDLDAEAALAVYRAASVSARVRHDGAIVWTRAAGILAREPSDASSQSQTSTRKLCRGLAYYWLSKAVHGMPGEAFRRADDEYVNFIQRAVTNGEEQGEPTRGPLEKFFRSQAKQAIVTAQAALADGRVPSLLQPELTAAQEDLGIVQDTGRAPAQTGSPASPPAAPSEETGAAQPQEPTAPEAAPPAAATEEPAATPEEPAGAQPTAFIGNKDTHVYHRPDCDRLPDQENRVSIASRDEAERHGYEPCQYCHPEQAEPAAEGGDADGR